MDCVNFMARAFENYSQKIQYAYILEGTKPISRYYLWMLVYKNFKSSHHSFLNSPNPGSPLVKK